MQNHGADPHDTPAKLDFEKRVALVLGGATKLAQMPATQFQNAYSHCINKVHEVCGRRHVALQGSARKYMAVQGSTAHAFELSGDRADSPAACDPCNACCVHTEKTHPACLLVKAMPRLFRAVRLHTDGMMSQCLSCVSCTPPGAWPEAVRGAHGVDVRQQLWQGEVPSRLLITHLCHI